MRRTAIIDGTTVEVRDGDTILEAARRHGIDVPTLCYHPGLAPEGNCRICLVEIDGDDRPHAACHSPLGAGMSVRTESPRLGRLRREILGLVASEHAGPGTISLSNSSLFPPSSTLIWDNPVTLPPGRARLSTEPKHNGVSGGRHYDGDGLGSIFGSHGIDSNGSNDDVNLEPDEIGGEVGEAI